jgi:YjbE family integral membrane protein
MYAILQLAWIVLIDAALSLDNAVVISTVANEVPEEKREQVKTYGILGAVVARIFFAFCAGWLLRYTAFTLAGGVYLVWVAYSMWRKHEKKEADAPAKKGWWDNMFGPVAQVIIADVMMSGDNILAIAHTARGNGWLMAFGIVLSIGLMFAATKFVSWLLETYPKTFYAACGVVAITGVHMVWIGAFTKV